jgi:hypothetical protein
MERLESQELVEFKSKRKISQGHLVTLGTLYINGNKPVLVKELFEAVLGLPCVSDRLNPWQYWRGVLYGPLGKELFLVKDGMVTLPKKVYAAVTVRGYE